MKHFILLTVSIGFLFAASICTGETAIKAEEKKRPWEKDFVAALSKGKIKMKQDMGLGYTPTEEELFQTEESILKTAIKTALDQEAPPCECMKIAVDLDYNPYSIIKNIYEQAGEIDLDQLCMCATEEATGIDNQIVQKAAADAVSVSGTPRFTRDEITQSQCLNDDVGLGFTLAAEDLTERIDPPDRPIDPVSPSIP